MWTHSLFQYENKNGHVKHLFHGNGDIYHQIIYNVDASLTMQQMRHHIQDEGTVSSRRRMSAIGNHCYIIGSSAKVILNSEEKDATKTNQESNAVFSRMYKAGVEYYSTRYVKDRELKGKIQCAVSDVETALLGMVKLLSLSLIQDQ